MCCCTGTFSLNMKYQKTSPTPSVFFKSFLGSKWHPKILQCYPKFYKPRYGFSLYWSKTIWGKHVFLHVAIATDGCNVIGRHNFLAKKLGEKNYKYGICALSCAAPRVGLVTIQPHICTVWCTKQRKHFDAIMEVFYCFTVAIDLSGDASDCSKEKRSAVTARIQNKVLVEWGNCESKEWDFSYLDRTETAVRK